MLTQLQERAKASLLIELVRCAPIIYRNRVIDNTPLQVYASAFVFSRTRSLIRGLFKEEEPKWITVKPVMGGNWSACLQTLEGHSRWVWPVAFSHDSTRLAQLPNSAMALSPSRTMPRYFPIHVSLEGLVKAALTLYPLRVGYSFCMGGTIDRLAPPEIFFKKLHVL
jgi:hypothetical protein